MVRYLAEGRICRPPAGGAPGDSRIMQRDFGAGWWVAMRRGGGSIAILWFGGRTSCSISRKCWGGGGQVGGRGDGGLMVEGRYGGQTDTQEASARRHVGNGSKRR